ncbi:MAG: FkbM family methyltransferase [Bacteroidales bacterium]|jgi:hypothetical protein|nr:FkbM family methyltransferase [Bacteroidales bacterium]
MKINLIGTLYTRLKYLKHRITNSSRYKLTNRVIQYIESDGCKLPKEEKIIIKHFLSKILVSQISYPWIKAYHYRNLPVYWDKDRELYYVLHHEKRLYFKKGLSKSKIREMYNALCIEMDVRSPHAYHAFSIDYQPSDIAVDIGSAEGIWALDIINQVSALYLFECEQGWIEALYATFAPWKEKVQIVNKYVSDVSDKTNVTLDNYFLPKNIFPTIIKADIEGAEISLVKGAPLLLQNHIRHAILCTYHHPDDFAILSSMMQSCHFEIQPSKGYMISIYSEADYGCRDITKIFRTGLIHACK